MHLQRFESKNSIDIVMEFHDLFSRRTHFWDYFKKPDNFWLMNNDAAFWNKILKIIQFDNLLVPEIENIKPVEKGKSCVYFHKFGYFFVVIFIDLPQIPDLIHNLWYVKRFRVT